MDTITIHKSKTCAIGKGLTSEPIKVTMRYNADPESEHKDPIMGTYVRMVGGEAVLTRKGAEAGWVLGDVPGSDVPKPAAKGKPIVRKTSRTPKPKSSSK
jgi:hypothetical protein